MSEFARAHAMGFDLMLRRRGEEALLESELVRCAPCYRKWREYPPDELRVELQHMRDVTARLADGLHVFQDDVKRALDGPFGHFVLSVMGAAGRLRSAPKGTREADLT